MAFCLPKFYADKFLEALKTGKIVPEKLMEMSSEDRQTFFKDIVGQEDAKDVNALFESKMLLKNQKQGLVAWAKKVSGISDKVRGDLIDKIEKMDKFLEPKDDKTFLADLAAKRLGVDVSVEEARKVMDLSKEIQTSRDQIKPDAPIGSEDRLRYGAARVAMSDYLDELKLDAKKMSLKDLMAQVKREPLRVAGRAVSDVAGIAKGIKASLDDSAIFRQGWKTVFTHPDIWAKNAIQSFKDIAKQIGEKPTNKDVMNGIKADIYSRPNAMNGKYRDMKLDVGIQYEEAFPSALPEKLPIFGRLYAASETAYQGFLYRMRADIADKYLAIADNNGIDLKDPQQLRSVGLLVNSLTGRGNLGAFEQVGKHINTIFFSPKMVKSSFDFLTLHSTDKMSVFARKEAAVNLLKVAAGMATIMAVAKAINPKSVDLNPNSSDFGKIRVKDTRFDISGGMASLITLASRMITGETKSSTTGKVTSLTTGKFGAPTRFDQVVNFASNKASPAASVLIDLAKGKTFAGQKPTLATEAQNLLVPLPITNAQELMTSKNAADPLISMIADALGIATNTYSPTKK